MPANPYTDAELPGVLTVLNSLSDASMPPEMYVLNASNLARLAATLAEIPALRKDKERLDWLENHAANYGSAIELDGDCWLLDRKTLRESLDAARSAGEG